MILSCEGHRYGHLDTLNIKIRPLFVMLYIGRIHGFSNLLRMSMSSGSSTKRISMGLDTGNYWMDLL